jgi:pyridoxamine 5'-phosphate oxidase
MIRFNINKKIEPYKIFLDKYKAAETASQKNIEAACLSTCSTNNTPNSRFINIKYINNDEFIFFSNYKSSKAEDIDANKNVSLTFFWNSINVQIRIQGVVEKLDEYRSDAHWKLREDDKNILSISSNQSSKIASYNDVIGKYKESSKHNILKRPCYWGGYVIIPNYFEIWQGHKSRINKREAFELKDDNWKSFCLEP